MENRIEREINKTLGCMDDDFDIQVSASFAEKVSGKLATVRVPRRVGYRGRGFYAVAISLLLVLNLIAVSVNFRERQNTRESGNDDMRVLAGEYGMGQQGSMAL
jgi:hypothetical protein